MRKYIILLCDLMKVTEEINPRFSYQELLNEHTTRLLIQLFTYQDMQCNPFDSLAAAVSEPALYRLLTFHVPNKMSLFLWLERDASSRNTHTPPGDQSGGVFYLRIVLSPEESSRSMGIS